MGVDEILFRTINGVAGQSSLLDWIGVELAKPGNLLYPILLAAAYWAWVNWRECVLGGAMLAVVVGSTDALGTQLKGLVQRPRPCVTLADVHQLLGCGGAFSFPSNHAANTAWITRRTLLRRSLALATDSPRGSFRDNRWRRRMACRVRRASRQARHMAWRTQRNVCQT